MMVVIADWYEGVGTSQFSDGGNGMMKIQ